MSKVRWTSEQQSVIDSRNGNLLVAAAAGSGKTAVLVERIIQMITDKKTSIDIDKLLVVTFTNAAAAEMKERVQIALEKLIKENPEDSEYREQLNLISQANITTIHSFCLSVVKENFYKINLDPDFRIGSECECELLKVQSIDEVFKELYLENDKDFISFSEKYGSSKGDYTLKNLILSIYNSLIATPNPLKWLDEASETFNIDNNFDFAQTDAGIVLLETLKIQVEGIVKSMESIVSSTDDIPEVFSYHQRYKNELEEFKKVLESFSYGWDDIKQALESVAYEDYRKGIKRVPAAADEEIKELQKATKKNRDKCRDDLVSIKDDIFYRTEEDIINEYNMLYPIAKSLSKVLKRFYELYNSKKKEKSIIDFNDIEHFALEILTTENELGEFVPSDVAKQYIDKFEEIFIDEYQDSSITQEIILSSISKGSGNRFMVGDIKQSIYKFRQARPDIFLEKYTSYLSDLNSINKKILLHKNFRSRKEILDGSNYIFEHLMKKDIGGVEYGEDEYLNLGRIFKENENPKYNVGGPAEVHLIYDSNKDSNNDDLENEKEELDNIQLEAKVVGNIIQKLLTDDKKQYQVLDKDTGEYRNAMLKDIVILLRSTANWQDIMSNELNKMGIMTHIDSSKGFFDSIEIKTIISILKAINDIYNDIALVSALRTPIFNFDMDEIIQIRENNSTSYFYNAVELVSNEDSPLGEKCKEFIDKIDKYRRYSFENSIEDTIWYIYTDSKYYYFASSLEQGDIRRGNLNILLQKASEFEKNNDKGLHYFIEYIENLNKINQDFSCMSSASNDSNAVKIMTIHKSKGLEFPIVICAGLGKQFNTMDLKNPILFHNDLGFGFQINDRDKGITYPSILKESIKSKMLIENLAEEIRILYVALTRAKEKLILTANVKNLDSSVEKWKKGVGEVGKLPTFSIINSTNYIDWVMPILIKHESFNKFREDYRINNALISQHSSVWDYELWDKSDIKSDYINLNSSDDSNFLKTDEILSNIHTFCENYLKDEEINIDTDLPDTVSVTKLLEEEFDESKIVEHELILPGFISEPEYIEELKANEIGTLVHEFMEKIDFNKTSSIKEIQEQLKTLVKNNVLTELEASKIKVANIYNFFESDLGKRLLKADIIKREQEIMTLVNAKDLYNINSDEEVLLKGIIDIYFEEDNEIVLIDYKTDYFQDEDFEKTLRKYKKQISLYAKSLENITNKKVKEKYIYSFLENKLYSF